MRKRKEVSADGKVTTVFKVSIGTFNHCVVILINAQQGSVFVEFKEQSNADKFIEAEELKYEDSVLLREFKYSALCTPSQNIYMFVA